MKYFNNLASLIKQLHEKDPNFTKFGADFHKYSFNPVINESEIANFEKRHKITLPDDYHEFVTLVGNGGAGPYYGIEKIDFQNPLDFRFESENELVLNKTFPHSDNWDADWVSTFDFESGYPDDNAIDEYWDVRHIFGAIPICHYGHGDAFLLVVNGNEKGNMWFDARINFGGLAPVKIDNEKVSFREWYWEWINNEAKI